MRVIFGRDLNMHPRIQDSDWLMRDAFALLPQCSRIAHGPTNFVGTWSVHRPVHRREFYSYRDKRYHATTPIRRRFERTRPPHPAAHVALTNPHSCQPPCSPVLCQGQPVGRRATSTAGEADAGRDIAVMTRLERMAGRPAVLDRKGRRTHGRMTVGGWYAMFVVEGGG